MAEWSTPTSLVATGINADGHREIVGLLSGALPPRLDASNIPSYGRHIDWQAA